MPTVVLFDIDGTLLTSGGAGRRAIDRAFGAQFGRTDACANLSLAGRTDRAIVRYALQAIGVVATAAAIEAVLDAYLGFLVQEVAVTADCRLHPGVAETLAALEDRPDFAIGLGTGNIEKGARIKLGQVGIADRFAFGGFGCDHEERGELLGIGAARGAARLGVERQACRVVVIGDTPRDVEAARHIGARSIAVATGPYTAEELAASGADHVFADLRDPRVLPAIVG